MTRRKDAPLATTALAGAESEPRSRPKMVHVAHNEEGAPESPNNTTSPMRQLIDTVNSFVDTVSKTDTNSDIKSKIAHAQEELDNLTESSKVRSGDMLKFCNLLQAAWTSANEDAKHRQMAIVTMKALVQIITNVSSQVKSKEQNVKLLERELVKKNAELKALEDKANENDKYRHMINLASIELEARLCASASCGVKRKLETDLPVTRISRTRTSASSSIGA